MAGDAVLAMIPRQREWGCLDRMCESKHEECDEAHGARYVGRQSRRPGAIGMPWLVSAINTAKPLTLNLLKDARSWASNGVDPFGVTHLFRELQISACEDGPQWTRENCVGCGSHPSAHQPRKR